MANAKIMAIMLMLLMVISIIPAVVADDVEINPTGDESEDAEESECTLDTDCEVGEYCDSDGECEDTAEDESEDETEDESETEEEDGSEDESEDESETEDEDEPETEDEDESDDEGELDEETEEELAAIISPYGAKVRLLQLEKSLTANILKGEMIIEYALEKNESADVSELNTILDEMKDLLDEVQELIPDDPEAELSGTGDELAKAFVDLKAQSIELTSQFREAARELLPEGYRNELKGELNRLRHQNIENIENKIKEARQEYNAEQITSLFEALRIEDEELLKAVEEGTATKEEIKDAIKEAISDMTDDEIADAMLNLRESSSKKAVAHKAIVAKAVENMFERQSQKWEERAGKFLNQSEEAKLKNQTDRSRIMGELSEKAENRSENLLKIGQTVKIRAEQRMGEIQGKGPNN